MKKIKDFIRRQVDQRTSFIIVLILIACFLLVNDLADNIYSFLPSLPHISFPWNEPTVLPIVESVEKFVSEQEFKDYIAQGVEQAQYLRTSGISIAMPETLMKAPMAEDGMGFAGEPERVSETTVQVVGIDEPDIVKTDGKQIYFSSKNYYWPGIEPIEIMEAPEMMIYPAPERQGGTKVIKAFPPADLELRAEINQTGDLLLGENILVVFSGQEIYGYDVSNPESPQQEWKISLDDNNFMVSARLYNNKIYLISQQRINEPRPCPITPLEIEGESLTIKCSEIYHPVAPISVDVTFIAMILDPASGDIENKVSFVGSSSSSVLYMSENAIYITYSYYESMVSFFSDFLLTKCQNLIPSEVINKIKRLGEYDISQQAKFLEMEMILEKYFSSLDNDEELKINNELSNRMTDYYKEHQRDLAKTGIVKIDLDRFDISASGNVPGNPLNQFALDEYQGYLRIATTIGETGGWGFFMGSGESANDVYVLDQNLKITGSVEDLGLSEKIYSVRFIEDKGYVVTFRQIDPFYVLDLSNPQNPELKGELKIPGYSAYLHPITKDKILGIGKENWQVKISLFDVSSPDNPKESDKYILDESWSSVLSTHHAFLLDKKHKIFFLPGSNGGYIFSYDNNELKLVRAISNSSVQRAIYIDDYLYIIADNGIVILNELDWQKVNELEF